MPASGPVTIRHVIDDEILLLDRRAALLTDPELAERSDNAVIASVDQPLEVLGPSAHERGEPVGADEASPLHEPGSRDKFSIRRHLCQVEGGAKVPSLDSGQERSTARRTISRFSCGIAYSRSPAAWSVLNLLG